MMYELKIKHLKGSYENEGTSETIILSEEKINRLKENNNIEILESKALDKEKCSAISELEKFISLQGRTQLENIYKANGLFDYQIKTTEDLLKVHGINIKEIEGYNQLDDLNKIVFDKFILNLINSWGLESRATLIPKAVYYVEETKFLKVDNNLSPEDYEVVAELLITIDKFGNKKILKDIVDFKENENLIKVHNNYLRFDFISQGKNGWLHVINSTEWY